MNTNTKKLLLLQLILALLCFLYNWYNDVIFDRYLSIFSSFIFIFLIVFFFLLLEYTIKYSKSSPIKIKVLHYSIFIITVVLAIYDFRFIKTKIEFKLYEKQRAIIIDNVKNDKYEYYFESCIKLPQYKYVSSSGQIYVYQNDEDQVISFPIYQGWIDSDTVELIYSSKDEKLIYETTGGHPINKAIKLKEHWYYVIKDY